jgi:hypothetical protein
MCLIIYETSSRAENEVIYTFNEAFPIKFVALSSFVKTDYVMNPKFSRRKFEPSFHNTSPLSSVMADSNCSRRLGPTVYKERGK